MDISDARALELVLDHAEATNQSIYPYIRDMQPQKVERVTLGKPLIILTFVYFDERVAKNRTVKYQVSTAPSDFGTVVLGSALYDN